MPPRQRCKPQPQSLRGVESQERTWRKQEYIGCRKVCGEVNARRAAQLGILNIALYMWRELGRWWSAEWRQQCTRPNDPWYYKRPRPEIQIHTGEREKSKSSKQLPAYIAVAQSRAVRPGTVPGPATTNCDTVLRRKVRINIGEPDT